MKPSARQLRITAVATAIGAAAGLVVGDEPLRAWWQDLRQPGQGASALGARLSRSPMSDWLGRSAHAAVSADAPASGGTVPIGAVIAPQPPAPPDPAGRAQSAQSAQWALAALDTSLVQQRNAAPRGAVNAFGTKSWVVAPPPPPPAPPPPPPPPAPAPLAPPLPFRYMGMLQESPTRTLWYLMQGDELIVAATGEQIGASYRVEGLEGGQLRFTYLPLAQPQMLPIGGPP